MNFSEAILFKVLPVSLLLFRSRTMTPTFFNDVFTLSSYFSLCLSLSLSSRENNTQLRTNQSPGEVLANGQNCWAVEHPVTIHRPLRLHFFLYKIPFSCSWTIQPDSDVFENHWGVVWFIGLSGLLARCLSIFPFYCLWFAKIWFSKLIAGIDFSSPA